jgi:hypothetical protein
MAARVLRIVLNDLSPQYNATDLLHTVRCPAGREGRGAVLILALASGQGLADRFLATFRKRCPIGNCGVGYIARLAIRPSGGTSR